MPRKRVESVYSMKSKNMFNKYAQLGGGLEEEIAEKRKELDRLEVQLKQERDETRRRNIERSIVEMKNKIVGIQEKLKAVLGTVASKAKEMASKLSSGASSLASKLSSGASSLGSKLSSGISSLGKALGITERYNQYKNERVIKDYYNLKATIVTKIERLKKQKVQKDDLCKRYTDVICNEEVIKKYNKELVSDEVIGGIPRLNYT